MATSAEPVGAGGGDRAGAPSARDRLRSLKAWAVATSLGAFGGFLGLALVHVTGVTARSHAGAPGRPDFTGAEQSFFGGSGLGGQTGFGFGSGGGGGASGSPAAATTVS